MDVQGIFDTILVKAFPAIHKDLTIFTQLTVVDERQCDIAIMLLSPSLIPAKLMGPTTAHPGLNGKVYSIHHVEQVSLPEAGTYVLQLLVNRKLCSEYCIAVVQREAGRSNPEPIPSTRLIH